MRKSPRFGEAVDVLALRFEAQAALALRLLASVLSASPWPHYTNRRGMAFHRCHTAVMAWN
jgi:hypothetical protein